MVGRWISWTPGAYQSHVTRDRALTRSRHSPHEISKVS